MKKLFWVLIAASTAIIASGVYLLCRQDEPQPQPETGMVGMINPWQTVNADEMVGKVEMGYVVDESENPTYLVNENIGMSETRFTDSETGIEWCVRVQKTDEAQDISGMYYTWADDNNGFEKQVEVNGTVYNQLSCVSGEQNVYVAYGYKDGYTVCFSCICGDKNIVIPQ